MYVINLETECESCGGSAHLRQVGGRNEIIIDFLEETPFKCKCGTFTYLEIEKTLSKEIF